MNATTAAGGWLSLFWRDESDCVRSIKFPITKERLLNQIEHRENPPNFPWAFPIVI